MNKHDLQTSKNEKIMKMWIFLKENFIFTFYFYIDSFLLIFYFIIVRWSFATTHWGNEYYRWCSKIQVCTCLCMDMFVYVLIRVRTCPGMYVYTPSSSISTSSSTSAIISYCCIRQNQCGWSLISPCTYIFPSQMSLSVLINSTLA